jgi:hypothetical protein
MVSAMNDYLFPWHAIRFYHPIRVIGSERAKIYSSAFGANRFSGKECLERNGATSPQEPREQAKSLKNEGVLS